MNLMATSMSRWTCRAIHTDPMPPRASVLSSRYFPAMILPSWSSGIPDPAASYHAAPHWVQQTVNSLAGSSVAVPVAPPGEGEQAVDTSGEFVSNDAAPPTAATQVPLLRT